VRDEVLAAVGNLSPFQGLPAGLAEFLGLTPQASSRPETALFGNFVVRLRIPVCGVLEYASTEILVFLELA
jgi:hypothetical protein